MRVLFVSNSNRPVGAIHHDPSVVYRCFNFAEALEQKGIFSRVISFNELDMRFSDMYDIVVFHRPQPTTTLKKFLKSLYKKRGTAIADYDDLIFRQEFVHEIPGVVNKKEKISHMKKVLSKNLTALSLFDRASFSTTKLASYAPKNINDIFVVHNGILRRRVETITEIAPSFKRNSPSIVIGYLSGTKSHDRDLASIEIVLQEFLERHPRSRFLIIGPVVVPPQILRFRRQLIIIPIQPYEVMFKIIATCDFTIAPLEWTAFNQCKSGLKFWESATVGVPVIATPIPDIKRLVNDGNNGYLAPGVNEWLTKLEEAYENRRNKKIRIAARKTFETHCIVDDYIQNYANWLSKGAG